MAPGIDWLGARESPLNFPDILIEDDFLVAFDKPGGIPVVPERRGAQVSLMGVVRARYGQSIASVHRLDAEASGIVLCAKTKPALDFLSGQFQSKTVRSTYYAMVVLLPDPVPSAGAVRDASGSLPRNSPSTSRPATTKSIPHASACSKSAAASRA